MKEVGGEIPQILHQVWMDFATYPEDNERPLPEMWQPFQDAARRLHPDWEYRVWGNRDVSAFVRREFPGFLEVFDGMPLPIMRADVIRYLIMQKIGGWYLDLDYELLRPLDSIEDSLALPINRDLPPGGSFPSLGNAIFGSVPGHPFWDKVLEALTLQPPTATTDEEVIAATGPGFLTRIASQCDAEGMEIPRFLRGLFHPPKPFSDRAYQSIVDAGEAYGVHHCDGAWRDLSQAQLALISVKQFVRRLLRR